MDLIGSDPIADADLLPILARGNADKGDSFGAILLWGSHQ